MQEEPHAIPFISFTKKGFIITSESQQFFERLEGKKVGIVSVVGKYRTGKSYFINKVLLQQQQGFTVDPTINACTKGIWIWSETIKQKDSDLEIVIMDTEGFGGVNEGQNHDTRIFLFSILLSSLFIYNSVGSITENSLQNLSLVVNLAKKIQKEQTTHQDDQFIQDNFPAFLWIVRDFSLELVDSFNNPITEKQYLERALELIKGNSDAVEGKNQIRRLIKHFFHTRDCLTMIRPVEKEEDIQKLVELQDFQLREEFLQQISRARNVIFGKVQAKKLKGQVVDGVQFLEMTRAYVLSVNTGKMPNVEHAWEYIKQQQNEKTVQILLDQFKELDVDMIDVEVFREQLIRKFEQEQVGEAEENTVFIEELNDGFDQIVKEKQKIQGQIKQQELAYEMEQIFNQLENDFKQEKIQNFDHSEAILIEQKKKLTTQYSLFLEEDDFRDMFDRQFNLKKNDFQALIIKQEQQKYQQREREKELEYLREQKEVQKKLLEFQTEKEIYQKNQLDQQERFKIQQDTNKELTEKLETFSKRISELERENQKMKEDYNPERDKKIVRFQEEIVQLQEEKQDLIKQKNDTEKEFSKKQQLLQQQMELIEKEKIQMQNFLKQTQEELNRNTQMCNQLQQQLKQLKDSTQHKILSVDDYEELLKQKDEFNQIKSQFEEIINEQREEKAQLKMENQVLNQNLAQKTHSQDYNMSKIQSDLENLLNDQKEKSQKHQKKLNDLKKLQQFSSILQCTKCKQFISNPVFLRHIQGCLTEQEKFDSDLNFDQQKPLIEQIEITIGQTLVREEEGKKKNQEKSFFTEYVIEIKKTEKNWYVSRKFTDFLKLLRDIKKNNPHLTLPPSCNELQQFVGDIWGLIGGRQFTTEGRRKLLQKILRELLLIQTIRNDFVFKLFIGEVGEANLKKLTSKAELSENSYYLKQLSSQKSN